MLTVGLDGRLQDDVFDVHGRVGGGNGYDDRLEVLIQVLSCVVDSYSITPQRGNCGSHFTYCHVHQEFCSDVDLVIFLYNGDVLLNEL